MTANRVHRRVIVGDYGKAIYKASSRTGLLAALEGCIEGYESLHTRAGMLQCDISPNNLMVNEEDDNPSWRSFLIDLDLAIKEQRENSSGAQGKRRQRKQLAVLSGLLFPSLIDVSLRFSANVALRRVLAGGGRGGALVMGEEEK